MHEKAKFVCFIYMQSQKVKFKSVQINMKQVSYIINKNKIRLILNRLLCNVSHTVSCLSASLGPQVLLFLQVLH